MTTLTQHVLSFTSGVRTALRYEPGITPDFALADLSLLLAVMFCIMWNGLVEAPAIYRYLEERGCSLDRDAVYFLLSAFEGDDPDNHLWSVGPCGNYRPIMGA